MKRYGRMDQRRGKTARKWGECPCICGMDKNKSDISVSSKRNYYSLLHRRKVANFRRLQNEGISLVAVAGTAEGGIAHDKP